MQRALDKVMTMVRFGDDLAALSTCKRKQVAAVVFPYDCSSVYAIGYNGPCAGRPNDACTGEPGKCGCAHAEGNAIAKLVHPLRKAILYTTLAPCEFCANLIVNSGCIDAVLYREIYRSDAGLFLLNNCGIKIARTDVLKDTGFYDYLQEWHTNRSGRSRAAQPRE